MCGKNTVSQLIFYIFAYPTLDIIHKTGVYNFTMSMTVSQSQYRLLVLFTLDVRPHDMDLGFW